MLGVVSWGRADHGQLGLGGGIEEMSINKPTTVRHLPWTSEKDDEDNNIMTSKLTSTVHISAICGGDEHTAVLSSNGRVFVCGSNDFSQLGHDLGQSKFTRVEGLTQYKIVDLSCGGKHCLALDQWGKVFSWGSDSRGQAGHNTGCDRISIPKMIRGLGTFNVIQVAAGAEHSLILTNTGRLFAFGDNSHGQLGLGNKAGDCVLTPQPIETLSNLPIKSISCGGYHSAVVTVSGAVYVWGKNTHGQCGLPLQNSNTKIMLPNQVRSLRTQRVTVIKCGEDHTVCLTNEGGVFSFGCGRYGQLGHANNNNEQIPRKIMELMGTEVSQIACGKKHTLVFVPSRDRVYSFGLAGSGQLGLSSNRNANTPQMVQGPWVSPTGKPTSETFRRSTSLIESEQLVVTLIGGGGDSSFAALCPKFFAEQKKLTIDHRKLPKSSQMNTINREVIEFFESAGGPSGQRVLDDDILEKVETIFQSVSSLNASLLTATHEPCSSKNSGIDLAKWRHLFSVIENCSHETLSEAVHSGITNCVIPNLKTIPPDVETLRIFVTLPIYHRFRDPSNHLELQTPFAEAIIHLDKNPFSKIEGWILQQDKSYFSYLVSSVRSVIAHLLKKRVGSASSKRHLEANLFLLRVLNRMNVDQSLIISYEDFYIPEVFQAFKWEDVYPRWTVGLDENDQPLGASFHICNYPFIFDATTKTQLLKIDQMMQMQAAVHQSHAFAFQHAFLMGLPNQEDLTFIVFKVRRENLLQDTLTQINLHSHSDFKKPLKVQFHGEDADDAGGVKKEFFLIFMKELIDPKYGMFRLYEDTRTIWFEPFCFEEDDINFFVVGVFCGLAIYNFVIINMPFPLPLYKKLLGEPVGSLEDLETLNPTVAKSLRDLLTYDGDDVEDVFCLNFVVPEVCFGEAQSVELKPNGENIPVKNSNREEYVKLYCDYVLNKSVEKKFEAFKKGFQMVCEGRVMELFHPHELMALVVGNENYDWKEFQENTDYKNGYSAEHPTIVNFWSVFHEELSEAEKRNFLLFLTGSDRIPFLGMKAVGMTIQKTSDINFLPVAHTCFNLLDLPEYATREKLGYKLKKAIRHFEGFGLV